MTRTTDKPLFIPLMAEHYTDFAQGRKTHEFRRYGPRWNETTCPVGRPAILSKGYGKQFRMKGEINHFSRRHASTLSPKDRQAVKGVYGTTDINIACIGITITEGE